MSWTDDLMRIMHLETVSTDDHASPIVETGRNAFILPAAVQFLRLGASRRRALSENPQTLALEAAQLIKDAEVMEQLAEAIKQGKGPGCSNWNTEMTWIVARKALFIGQNEAWMAARHPTFST